MRLLLSWKTAALVLHHLLTVGDPTVVTNLCNEAWQGISTIFLLALLTDEPHGRDDSWKLEISMSLHSATLVLRTLAQRMAGGDSTNKAQVASLIGI
jgi:hypothetical protein